MKYSQLIDKCIQLMDSYDQKLMTPDSHAEQFFTTLKCEDTQRVFMRQIFYGCERYRNFIKVSNNLIFKLYAGTTNRKNDSTLFAIFTYLICFRMDELPFNQFKKIVLSQDAVKINVLFGFIFNFDTLKNQAFQQWQQSLELDYLQNKLLPKLVERKQKCEQLIAKIVESATGKKVEGSQTLNSDQIKDKKKATVIQEFNLTKPKPKLMPQLQKIQVGFKANPVPKAGKELKQIEEEKKLRRKQIHDNIKKNYNQNKQQFEFQTSKRPINFPKIKQEVQKMTNKELLKKVTAKPMPQYKDVDVKLNVAAILLQEKKLNQKIEQQQKKMKDLQINMRDQSQYENWRKQMKEKDKYEQLEAQQRKKIQMQLARQAAMQAYQQKIDQKRALVNDMKEIAAELKLQREGLEIEQLQNKKKLIQEVQQSKENIKVQQEKILQKNKKIHDQQKEERKRILQKKKQQQKVQMLKKKQLIQQIRQLEKKIRARPKQQIEYVSIGLMEEMTLEELQNRLADVKRQRKQQQEKRRASNIKKKQDFKQTLNMKKDNIMARRDQLAKQKQQERLRKKQEAELQKQRLAEVKARSVNQYKKKQQVKAEKRKIQKQKLAKQIKETQQRRMFLMQGQAQQQANAFGNLQKGEERYMLDRQNNKLIEQYKRQSIKEGEMAIIANKNKREVQKKIQFNKLYKQEQDLNNRLAQQMQQEDVASKAMKYQQVRTFEQKHTLNMTKSNPYKAKVAEMSLTNAKVTKT